MLAYLRSAQVSKETYQKRPTKEQVRPTNAGIPEVRTRVKRDLRMLAYLIDTSHLGGPRDWRDQGVEFCQVLCFILFLFSIVAHAAGETKGRIFASPLHICMSVCLFCLVMCVCARVHTYDTYVLWYGWIN
jgi:hypothetical protein